MTDDAHRHGCPKRKDPAAHCQCAAIDSEDRLIERGSRPSPSEVIRRAKAKGFLRGGHPYSASP